MPRGVQMNTVLQPVLETLMRLRIADKPVAQRLAPLFGILSRQVRYLQLHLVPNVHCRLLRSLWRTQAGNVEAMALSQPTPPSASAIANMRACLSAMIAFMYELGGGDLSIEVIHAEADVATLLLELHTFTTPTLLQLHRLMAERERIAAEHAAPSPGPEPDEAEADDAVHLGEQLHRLAHTGSPPLARDHGVLFWRQPNCFTGAELVRWLVAQRRCDDLAGAEALAQRLLAHCAVYGVSSRPEEDGAGTFRADDTLYRFAQDAPDQRRALSPPHQRAWVHRNCRPKLLRYAEQERLMTGAVRASHVARILGVRAHSESVARAFVERHRVQQPGRR